MKNLLFILLFFSLNAFPQSIFVNVGGPSTQTSDSEGSLMDPGKGTFDSGTESWIVAGGNGMENDEGALKITYFDNSAGATCDLSEASDLITNLTIGKTYTIYARAKINEGSATLRVSGPNVNFATVDATEFTWYSGRFVATQTTADNFRLTNFGTDEIVWIDEWGIEEWDGYYGQYFVDATGGDDSDNGLTSSQAWKTVDAVNNYSSFASGDTISFKCGKTWRETLTVPDDSLTFMNYGTGDTPIISGFTEITNWIDYGAGTIYYKEIACNSDILNLLIVDGVNTSMGREPETDNWWAYESHSANTSITDDELTELPDWGGAEAVIRKGLWMLDRNVITDHTGTTLTYTTGSAWTPTDTYGYFVQNSFDALDNLGEWFYDGDTLFMYFGAETPGDYTVKAATVDTLLIAVSKDYVTIDGIDFEGADKWAIMTESTEDFTIKNCSIQLIGGIGIYTNTNSSGASLTIDNCFIEDCNEEAIDLKGINTYGYISNNMINRIGIIPGSGSSNDNTYDGIDGFGNNSIVEYNVIDSIGHSGISARGRSGHIIRYNLISNYGLTRYDAGGIYSWDYDDTITDRTIRKNMVYDSKQTSEGIGGGTSLSLFGIYLDENVTKCLVDSNVVFNNSTAGIFNLNADTNTFRNNLAYNNGVSQLRITHAYGYGQDVQGLIIKHNQFICRDSSQLVFRYRDDDGHFNLIGTVDSNYYARPVDDDYTIQTYDDPVTTDNDLADWQTLSSQDANSATSPEDFNSTDSIHFNYNTSFTANKTWDFSPDTLQEIDETQHIGSVILPPLTGMVLLSLHSNPIPAVYTDDFATNYDPLTTDADWSVSTGLLKANGGVVYPVTSVPNRAAAYFEAVFNANQYAEVVLAAAVANTYIGPAVRGSSNNFYGLRVDDNDYVLEKFVAGTPSDIATGAGTFVATDTIRLEISGTTLKMYKNDVQFGGDQTDSDLPTGNAGVCGYNYSSDTNATSWEGGDL